MGEVTWHPQQIQRKDREDMLGQKGCLVWLTGLSGSGKSTIAARTAQLLHESGRLCYVLDGDNIRQGLCNDLGFDEIERRENIRRIREVGKLFVDAGIITFAAFISPYRSDRARIRDGLGDRFIEVHAKCSIEECEKRDVKGLYKKARNGEIPDFTGISSPYEEPDDPEVILDTCRDGLELNAKKLVDYLESGEFI
ncbi:adenylyl-sulfate kinase [Candidatus Altiarchaeota archaeon]